MLRISLPTPTVAANQDEAVTESFRMTYGTSSGFNEDHYPSIKTGSLVDITAHITVDDVDAMEVGIPLSVDCQVDTF